MLSGNLISGDCCVCEKPFALSDGIDTCSNCGGFYHVNSCDSMTWLVCKNCFIDYYRQPDVDTAAGGN